MSCWDRWWAGDPSGRGGLTGLRGVCYHASTTVKEASLNLVARIALSMLPSLCLGFLGILLRAFDIPAALVGLAAGILLTYAFGLGGFAVLLTFVVFGGVVTGLGYRRKAARGIGEPRGGKRTWRSALGNLLVPAMGAVAGIIWPHGLAVFLAVGSLATATFDTVASEVGKAFSSEGVTLHDLKMKPAGSPGGVSVPGTLSGAAAALGVCLVALVFDLVGAEMLIWILMAAFVGTMIESLLKSGCGLRATQTANVINTAAGGSLAVFMAHVLEGK